VAYNIQNLEARLTRYLHGTTLDQVTNPFDLIYDSAQMVLLDLDPQETKVITQIPLFNQVYDCPCPADLKGNGSIDISPQVNRQWQDYWSQKYNQQFDISKITDLQNSFTVLFNSATKSLRINSPTLLAPTILNQASAVSNNGTWTVDGTQATNLTANNTNFQSGGGALQFNYNGGGAGQLRNTTSGSIDISSMLNQGSLFCYIYFPTTPVGFSINLQWGSDSGDNYSLTTLTNQLGNTFNIGWNLLQFPWANAAVNATPNPKKITYLQLQINGNAQTGILVNNIFAAMPLYCNLEYYSKYLFRDGTTGAFKEIPTATSDIVNLDTESYNILVYQCGLQMAQQQQGVDALFYDANYFSSRYDQAVERYKALYKSEKQLTQASYYTMPNKGYNQTINSNTFWGN
jgi:hypothetical protein